MRALWCLTLPCLTVLAGLAGCATPPADSYVQGSAGRVDDKSVDLGRNTVNEACVQSASAGPTTDVYCGAWQQPSAHVRLIGSGDLATAQAQMAASPWRANLDAAYLCGAARPVTLASGPALQMECTGKVGGWPYVALAAGAGGRAWLADGVVSAVPAIGQSIGVLSGQITAQTVSSGAVLAMQAERTGARARATGDSRQYGLLMLQGAQANLVDNPVAAESAYGAALSVQEKALGRDNPNLAEPLMHLALQLSNEGRYGEADGQFSRAEVLAPRQQGDETLQTRLLYYEGLHAMNQKRFDVALDKLNGAEAGYLAVVDPAQLRPRAATNGFTAALEDVVTTPADRLRTQHVIGLMETWRSQAEVLRGLNRSADSVAKLQQATALARNAQLNQPRVTARLRRSEALSASRAGQEDDALTGFDSSQADFQRAYPNSRPFAMIGLLNAQEMMARRNSAGAVAACRTSVQVLVDVKSGYTPDRLAPCLDAFAAEAAKATGAARQDILAQMFLATQVARSSQTELQISLASARLGTGKDTRVAEAVRSQQDAATALVTLRRRLDEANTAGGKTQSAAAKALAGQVEAAEATAEATGTALQAAAPNYGQLVQQVTPAADILALLGPDEAFVSVTLTAKDGWVFLLRQGSIAVAPVAGGAGRVDPLVSRIRAAMTPATPTFDAAAAQALYTGLFGTFGPQLAGVKGLTVAPSGSLLALPFGVLLTGPAQPDRLGDAPWLARQMAVGHVPSAGSYVALRKVAGVSKAPNPWFGFGDFRPVSLAQARQSFGPACGDSAELLARIPPLPSARQELSVAARIMGAGPGDELLGDRFTVPAVRRTDLATYRILHFATHAILPSDLKCQAEAAIITSPDKGAKNAATALLTASDLTEIKLDADLVILSACNSGGSDGQLTGGESLSALARSFFYGGARGLMITHWEVSDQAATFITADTLRRLKAEPGLSGAQALQSAQVDVLEKAGKGLPAEFAHPFYWAPFALIGQSGTEATRQTAARGMPARS